jgi:prepilin-type N-terminal cleavage/methylation domain-containing protein
MGKITISTYQRRNRVAGSSVLAHQAGFTLIELIAVLILLSVLAAVAVPRYIDLDENARSRAINAGISELNGREGLAWSNIKLTPANWQDDQTTFDSYDKELGNEYLWTPGDPDIGGGEIKFGHSGTPVTLTRIPSTTSHPGQWSK